MSARCQSAFKTDPLSASKIDPPVERLVPVVHRGDPRAAECLIKRLTSGARGVPVDPPVQAAGLVSLCRSRVVGRLPGGQRDRDHRLPATPRRWRCLADWSAALPTKRRIKSAKWRAR